MFRPRIDTPIVKAQEPSPQITGSWMMVNVWSPIFRSLYSGLWVGIAVSYAIGYLTALVHGEPVSGLGPTLAMISERFLGWFIIGVSAFWFVHAGGVLWIIDTVEHIFGVELDGRDTRRALNKTPVGHILIEPWKAEKAVEIDARQRARGDMERFIYEAERNSTHRHLDQVFGGRWYVWKAKLVQSGWIVIDDPGRKNSTWHLRCSAEETIAGAFKMEIEDVREQRAKLGLKE